jgi:trehalose 6-phosphate synthase
MQACHGTWVAWGSGNADRETVDAQDHVQVPPHDPQYTLRRVWLSDTQVEGFYAGFANSTLWPLCHLHLDRTVYAPAYWRAYQEVNARFAEAVAEECGTRPALVWFQDYHLALCPAALRRHRPDLTLMHFWHIPWPPWDLYRTCPWRRELLEGLLGNDLLGFHLAQHSSNFLTCAERVLGADIDAKSGAVRYAGHTTWVRAFPISIDYDWWRALASAWRTARRIKRLRMQPALAHPILGLGVDRLDYTKGIVRRLLAIERFLEHYPAYQGRLGFVQIAVPSRTEIEAYRLIKQQVETAVDRINQRFGTAMVPVIHYRYEHVEPAELAAYYRMADFAMVTSLHDGMNLVAKEFVASQVDRRGVLLCSEFAGAAEALDQALLINPYDIDSVVATMHRALEMSEADKAQRLERLQSTLAHQNVYQWLADIFTALDHLPEEPAGATLALMAAPVHHPPALRGA